MRRALVVSFWVLAGCGPGAAGGRTTVPRAAPFEQASWTGTVRYEARSPTPTGASRALEVRPARGLDFDLRDARDQVVARGATDDAGHFEITAPRSATTIVIYARTHARGHVAWVSPDPMGTSVQQFRAPLGAPGVPLALLATDAAAEGPAGALHIVDTLLRGLDRATEWSAEPLPPIYVFWRRGGNAPWSYYLGERPARSGRFALELMGGEAGRVATTDTDEHDESIILHELGHFVFDRLSSDSSPGGDHPAGYVIDPGLAWEEGRATWFSMAVLGVPVYRDTIGIEGQGRLRVDHELERGVYGPGGIGSEQGVSRVLWDLGDGTPELSDVDNDGVAIGPAAVLRSMIAMGREPGAYPTLPTFLRYLVRTGVQSHLALKQMLLRTNEPANLLPDDDVSPWPVDVATGVAVNGKIDGLTNPAPSGGPRRPENGVDALRVYRIAVPQRSFLMLRLQIFGTGRGADHQDADLELRNIRADLIERSISETPSETIGRIVDAGSYIVYVRDGGHGNKVGYELTVDARPL